MRVISIIIMVLFSKRLHALEPCDSVIYCKGTMYGTIQDNGVLVDYVYNKLLASPETVLKGFSDLSAGVVHESIEDFVEKYYDVEKDIVDTEEWQLTDQSAASAVLAKINDRNLVQFTEHLIKLIPTLAIKGTKLVKQNADRYSLLSTDGFIRRHKDARESLYWDQYWVINGLLMCEMYETAKALMDSLISMVRRFGHVPRGNRIHYVGRSHPPLLTVMAYNYFNKTNDREWLNANIAYLDVELMFWVLHKNVAVTKNGNVYQMYRYAVNCSSPRPESYRVDTRMAADMTNKAIFYTELHSASESGWDLSARWLFGPKGGVSKNVEDLFVTRVVPVDLNAYLAKDFKVLAKLYDIVRDKVKQAFWAKKSKDLEAAIKDVLWNKEVNMWNDYDMILRKHREEFFISNLMPLWASAYHDGDTQKYGEYAVEYLKKHRVMELYKGGIPVTLYETQESFDFPNSYVHLQIMVLQGLRGTMYKEAERYGSILFTNWLDAVLSCWAETKSVFDSYNAIEFGQHMTYNDWYEDYSITIGAFLDILGDYYVLDTRQGNGSSNTCGWLYVCSVLMWYVVYLPDDF